MNKVLENQTAIVTGATSGIGRAIAFKFAEQGARVAVLGTNDQRGMDIAERINTQFGDNKATYYKVDVSNFQAVADTIQKISDEFGQIDILVNNAGITNDGLMLKMTEEEWDSVMDTNVKSAFNTVKAVSRTMLKARKGKIINMSSVIGLIGNPGQVNYASSKAALIGFSKALAKEFAARNICVNCIAPGFIETPMTDEMSEEQRKAITDQIPLKRLGKPEDIADMALFLASPQSDYITGQVFIVDGGMVM